MFLLTVTLTLFVKFQSYTIRSGKGGNLPFVICDVMGMEPGDSGTGGVHPDDLVHALEGHIKDGYKVTAHIKTENLILSG